MSLYRIRCLLVKEFNQLRRDRKIFGILLITPVIQLIVFGLAATTDLREVSLAVRDQDHSYLSREYVRSLESSGYFQTTMLGGSDEHDGDLLVAGKAGLVLVIPVDFGKALVASRPASVQVLVDGSDSNFGVQGLNYLQKATRLFSERLVRVEIRRLQQVRGDHLVVYSGGGDDLIDTLRAAPLPVHLYGMRDGDQVGAVISVSYFRTALRPREVPEKVLEPVFGMIRKIEAALAFMHGGQALPLDSDNLAMGF